MSSRFLSREGKVQNVDPWSMEPLRGPGPWTGSIKMDRVHGPLFLPKHKQTKTKSVSPSLWMNS